MNKVPEQIKDLIKKRKERLESIEERKSRSGARFIKHEESTNGEDQRKDTRWPRSNWIFNVLPGFCS